MAQLYTQSHNPELRSEPRYPMQGEAEILKDGAPLFRGRVLNISPSGCYIQTRDYIHLSPCARVEIELMVGGKIVPISAEVRFCSPNAGIGFRFLEADRAIQSILDGILVNLRFQQQEDPTLNTAPSLSLSRSAPRMERHQ
jgi:hypothetical protein